MKELTKIFNDYMSINKMTDPKNKKNILLDAHFLQAFFSKKKHGVDVGSSVEKKDVAIKLKDSLIPYHMVVIDGFQEVLYGKKKEMK